MTKRDFLSVMIRVVGFWYFVQALMQIEFYASYSILEFNKDSTPSETYPLVLAAVIVAMVLYFLTPLLLIFKADWFAKKLISIDTEESLPAAEAKPNLFIEPALVVLGVYFVVSALADALQTAVFIARYLDESSISFGEHPDVYRFITPLVRLILGIYLVLGANQLIRLRTTIRGKLHAAGTIIREKTTGIRSGLDPAGKRDRDSDEGSL